MPMVYRSPPQLVEAKREKSKDKHRPDGAPRPVSDIGGGRGGSLMAFAEASGVTR